MDYGLYDFPPRRDPDFKGGKAEDIGEHIMLDQERCVLLHPVYPFRGTRFPRLPSWPSFTAGTNPLFPSSRATGWTTTIPAT